MSRATPSGGGWRRHVGPGGRAEAGIGGWRCALCRAGSDQSPKFSNASGTVWRVGKEREIHCRYDFF
jgi:hypothetical protein